MAEPKDGQSADELIAKLNEMDFPFGDDQPSGFQRMTEGRFNALAVWGLPQGFREDFVLASFWSGDNERLLAFVYHDPTSLEAGVAFVARDEQHRFRVFGHHQPLPSVRAAESAIRGNWGRSVLASEPEFDQLDDQPEGTDLFGAIKGVKRHHPGYLILRDSVNQSAAKALLSELSHWVPDLDGNLARDFQTRGYSARIWEIYLLFAFREMNWTVSHLHAAPDYHLVKGHNQVFVEATTVNPEDPMTIAGGADLPPGPPENFWDFIEQEMTLKFGSPLHSKMAKRYWELPHVTDNPLVLAVADFHGRASMTWSHTALSIYLNGLSATVIEDEDGKVKGKEKVIPNFLKGANKIVPFFEQPDTEHISAILFSNAGTIAKFNRMGVRAGFGDPFVTLRRKGGWSDPRPDAFEAIPFDMDVENPHYSEKWADELEMHHNPKALHPIDEDLFPGIAHFRYEDGEAGWTGPSPRVLFSSTMSLDRLGRQLPTANRRRARKPKPTNGKS